MQKIFRSVTVWAVILILFYSAYALLSAFGDKRVAVEYSELVKQISYGNAVSVEVSDKNAVAKLKDDTVIVSTIPSREVLHNDIGDEMVEMMENGSLVYKADEEKTSVWTYIFPILGFAALLVFVMFITNGGARNAQNFGRSRAKLYQEGKTKVTFASVAGAKEEKEEMAELVDFLKDPQKFTKLGARIPKGVLLVGPPGTGKTLLARAVAGEAGVPFFSISGSDFVEMYVGVGASRVRDLFEQAKKAKPCIVFIDEIDAVGRKRGSGMGGGHDEREQTLNQLLVEMDGFGKNEGVIIIAATNRPDILDNALLRPGRFDRQIVVDVPDVTGREEILEIYAKEKPISKDVDLKKLAKNTAGSTGAELENIMNEAAIFAARRDKKEIDEKDIADANTKVLMGPEKRSHIIKDDQKRITAYHEAGHALIVKFISKTDKVSQISIIPRGRSGGHTMYNAEEDNVHITKSDILAKIAVALGGRAAESIVLDDITTGASEDIKYATNLARKMVTMFGMSDKMGLVSYDSDEEVFLGRDLGVSKTYSEAVAAEIDAEIREIISKQFEVAKDILIKNKSALDAITNTLIEKETITGEEFDKIINENRKEEL